MDYVLALDVGTTNVKAAAFDQQGNLLAKESLNYPILSIPPDLQEQIPEVIAAASETCITNLVKTMAHPPLGISLSSAMHSLIVMDKNHQPLTNSIIWADGRSAPQAQALKASSAGTTIYHRTGTPIHAMSPLCKIAWLRLNQPDVFHQAAKFISIKEFLLFRWLGQYVVDESIASATGLFDIYEKTWYSPALAYLGINTTQLSQPVPTSHLLLGIKTDARIRLGLNQDVPIVVGASDGCLANLGEQVLDEREAAMSIGTSGAIRITSRQPIRDEEERIFNYILDETYFVVGGATNNGGIVHEWISHLLPISHQAMEKVPIGAEGLFFLPYLLGERAPIWDSHAKGAFIGLNIQHSAAHLYQAVLEGIAFNLLAIFDALQSHAAPIKHIYANGGFMKNEKAVQILSDAFGIPISLQTHEEGAALGAAWLGWKALGRLDSWSQLPRPNVKKTYHPNLEHHQKYQNLFVIWKPIYDALKPTFYALEKYQSNNQVV
ncbi:MAG: gluconokinase [Saprospiraceae bacterium]|nr:gluconokinase [Saprospiraceae bacterium]